MPPLKQPAPLLSAPISPFLSGSAQSPASDFDRVPAWSTSIVSASRYKTLS